MSKILTFQSRSHRWGITILALAIAFVVRIILYPQLEMASSGIFILPIVAGAWFLGLEGLVGITIVSMLFSLVTSVFLFDQPLGAYPWESNLLGGMIALLIGMIIIRMRRMTDERTRVIEEQTIHQGDQKRQMEFLTLLNDIVHAALEAEDLKSLLTLLTRRAGGLFSADDCFITLWDETNKVAVPTAAFGSMSQDYDQVRVYQGERTLTSSCLETGRPLVVEDTANTPYVDKRVAIPFPKLRTALGLPLIAGERKLGALILGYHHKHTFAENEIAHGEMAARQISLAMMKAILLEDTRRNLERLAGMHAIAQVFTLQEDSDHTFGMLTRTIAGLLKAERCLIVLKDSDGSELVGQTSAHGLTDAQVLRLRMKVDAALEGWKLAERPVLCANRAEEMPPAISQQAGKLGIRNMLAVPLRDAGQALMGLLLVANKQGPFGQDDLTLLQSLASQAAVVVENTRLLSTERRWAKELAVLNKLAEAASVARHEDALIAQATQLIGEQLYPDNFGIMLMDAAHDDLYLHSSYQMGAEEEYTRIPIGTGITGWVAQTGRTRCVEDVRKEKDYIDVDVRARSELCVPLKAGDQLIGVINVESIRVGAFNQEDVNLLGIIAGQLASAIQRLRTADAEYHQNIMLKRANALVRVLAQVGSRVAAASNPQMAMQTLGEEVTKIGLTCLVTLPRDEQTMVIAFSSLPKRTMKLFARINKQSLDDIVVFSKDLLPGKITDLKPELLADPLETAMKLLPGTDAQAATRVLRKIGITQGIPVCQLPLTSEGKLQGMLWLWGEGIKEGDLPTMSIFGNQVAIALQNTRLLTEVQRLAVIDHGTGIFNRRHFFQLAEQEFSRAHRYNHPLSAVIVDVDNFKVFNDRYGHVVGDQVLYLVAQTLKSNLREGDILGRYGGEEFSILLPYTGQEAARVVAERLCSRVGQAKTRLDGKMLSITVSIGVAEMRKENKSLLALVELADQAMYAAKEAGGDRVCAR